MTKRSFTKPLRCAQTGQGLMEYTMIGALIAVASVGVMTLMGGKLSAALEALQADMLSTGQVNQNEQASAVTPTRSISETPAYPASEGIKEGSATAAVESVSDYLAVTDAEGKVVYMPRNAKEMRTLVETAGANGATDLMSASLGQLATQLLTEGKIDEVEANKLHTLAKQGHRIAQIEKLLENAIAQSSTSQELKKSVIHFEGKSYTAEQLQDLIGWPSGKSTNEWSDPLSTNTTAPETQKFLNLYHEVASSGMLADPQIANEVSYLSTHISYMSDVVAATSWEVANDHIQPGDYAKKTQWLMKSSTAISTLTTEDANQICDIGKGKSCKS